MRFVFSDRHAYLAAAQFYDDPARLDQIDWDILQRRDFQRDPNNPAKVERYQAELLAGGHVPVQALLGIVCHSELAQDAINLDMQATGVVFKNVIEPRWYFE